MAFVRLAPGIVLLHVAGHDVGHLGDRPRLEAERLLGAEGELFIDAREARGASIDVSGQWASWLMRQTGWRTRMLVRAPFMRLSAEFVARYGQFGDRFRVMTDEAAFEAELGATLARDAARYAAHGSSPGGR